MTEERFLTLAAAYGADPRRWPHSERAAAMAFADANPAVARPWLTAERLLDEALDRYEVAAPASALRDRVVAAARRAASRRTWRWLVGAGLGMGLASSAVAGAVAGYTLGRPEILRLSQPGELDAGEVSSLAGDAANG
jgi:hypothetical protein